MPEAVCVVKDVSNALLISNNNNDNTHDIKKEPSTELSANEKKKFAEMAKSMVETLIKATNSSSNSNNNSAFQHHSSSNSEWTLVHEKHHISVYREAVAHMDEASLLSSSSNNNYHNNGDSNANVYATSTINSPLTDIMDTTVTDTSVKFCKMMEKLRPDDFVDGAVLHTVVPRSESRPYRFIGIKHALYSEKSNFTKDRFRDFVFLEYNDVITTNSGSQIGFRVFKSIDDDCSFSTQNSFVKKEPSVIRSEIPLTGFFYYPTSTERLTKVAYVTDFAQWKNLPEWAANAAVQNHMEKTMSRVSMFIDECSVGREDFAFRSTFLDGSGDSSDTNTSCNLCNRQFSQLRRHRHYCKKCSSVVCGACSVLRMIKVNPVVGERQVRICTSCAIEPRHTTCFYHNKTSRELLPHTLRHSLSNKYYYDESSTIVLSKDPEEQTVASVIDPKVFSDVEDIISAYTPFDIKMMTTTTTATESKGSNVVLFRPSEVASFSQKPRDMGAVIEQQLDMTDALIKKPEASSTADVDVSGTASNDSVDLQDALYRSRELIEQTASLANQTLLLMSQQRKTSSKKNNGGGGGLILYDDNKTVSNEKQKIKELESVTIQNIPLEVGPWLEDSQEEKAKDLRNCLYLFC